MGDRAGMILFRRSVALVLFLISGGPETLAQTQPISPELLAAYCVGALNQDIAVFEGAAKGGTPIEEAQARAIVSPLITDDKVAIKTYWTYLLAKQMTGNTRSAGAMFETDMAMARGRNERK